MRQKFLPIKYASKYNVPNKNLSYKIQSTTINHKGFQFLNPTLIKQKEYFKSCISRNSALLNNMMFRILTNLRKGFKLQSMKIRR